MEVDIKALNPEGSYDFASGVFTADGGGNFVNAIQGLGYTYQQYDDLVLLSLLQLRRPHPQPHLQVHRQPARVLRRPR